MSIVSTTADNGRVTDQLSLSIWLEPRAQGNRLRYFQSMLRLFPFSQREQPQSSVSVQAVSVVEPPLLERALNGPFDLADVEAILGDYQGSDVAYQIESWWDLWVYDNDWALKPTRVAISCFGPHFDSGTERKQGAPQEDLRIDFGVDSHFLPDLSIQGSGRMAEANIKSLLRLVHEIDSALPVSERRLETESGENFVERLQGVLSGSSPR